MAQKINAARIAFVVAIAWLIGLLASNGFAPVTFLLLWISGVFSS